MRCFLSAPFAFAAFDVIDRRCSGYEVERTSTDRLFTPSLYPHYRDFLTTMGSADFSQFVVTTANETACETSTLKVHALSPHPPATFTGTSSNFWTLSPFADLSVFPSLICGSCPSGQGFAYSFLQIPPHDGHPCCSAMYFVVAYAYSGLSPVRARPWRANKKRTQAAMARVLRFCPYFDASALSGGRRLQAPAVRNGSISQQKNQSMKRGVE